MDAVTSPSLNALDWIMRLKVAAKVHAKKK